MIYDSVVRSFQKHGRGGRISLLVPFRTDHAERERNWLWLQEYYRHALPDAELIIGTDDRMPFCKTAALNRAFMQSTGDVIVILDADCYISPATIRECARRIRESRAEGGHLWYLPYKNFYRLTEPATMRLLESDPDYPLTFPDPPAEADLDTPDGVSFGHWYGALIQMMPREAFLAASMMDERFQGWGGEDVSFMYAVDTMYGRHKLFNGPVFHMHHPTIKGKWKYTKQWEGQITPEMNDKLSTKYEEAVGDRKLMRKLIKAE